MNSINCMVPHSSLKPLNNVINLSWIGTYDNQHGWNLIHNYCYHLSEKNMSDFVECIFSTNNVLYLFIIL